MTVLSISLSLHREQRELCVKEALQRNTCSQYPGIKDSTKADCLGRVYYLPCHLGASPFSWVQLLIHTDWRLDPCFHSTPKFHSGTETFSYPQFLPNPIQHSPSPSEGKTPSVRKGFSTSNTYRGLVVRDAAQRTTDLTEAKLMNGNTERKPRDSGLNDLCYPLSKCSGTEVHRIWNFFWILEYFHPPKK